MPRRIHPLFKILFGSLLAIVSVLVNTSAAHAYPTATTHPALSDEIVDVYNATYNDKLTAREKEYLVQGSIDEDTAPRWINHFYDPTTQEGWEAEHLGKIPQSVLKIFSKLFLNSTVDIVSSKNWAANENLQTRYISYGGNKTWQNALRLYGEGKTDEAYYALGHLMHLIEDATVPDHTRNDTHAHEGSSLSADDGSPYEDYADQFTRANLRTADSLIANKQKPVLLPSFGAYLENLATYSNGYFFSEHTINEPKYVRPKIVREDGEYGYGRDANGGEFRLVRVLFSTGDSLEKIKIYTLRNEGNGKNIALPDYFTRLSTQAVLNGAGVIRLFKDEAEKVKLNMAALPPRPTEPGFFDQARSFGFGFIEPAWNKLKDALDNKEETSAKIIDYFSDLLISAAINPSTATTETAASVLDTTLSWFKPTPLPALPAISTDSLDSVLSSEAIAALSKATPTSTAPTPTTFKPPQGNLVLYPTTPKPTYTTIEPLVAATVRTPDPVVLGNGSLAKVTLSDSARSKQIVDSFNAYLEALHRLEQTRAPSEAGTMPTAEDVRSVVGAAELRSAVDLVGKVTTQEQLSAQLSDSSTTPAAVAGLLLILFLSLSSWALSYEEARLQAERMRALDKEASDFKVAALQAEEQAIKEALAKIVVPTPKLFRTDDWIDPNGKHFPVYGFVVNGVWHNILDTSEVERIFGKENTLPRVSYGSYSNGWDSVHGGGTVGGAMTLRQLWQMQSAVIHDGTLPSTIEQYARGEKGTMHPLGWTFTPSQMYNPQNKTIYIVDQSSMGRFNDILGWTAISTDTPKTTISTLAFDTPEAFLNKTPWDKEITLRNLEYQPNQTYATPVSTDFEKYFKEERAKGRSTEDIYQHNPFQVIAVPNQTNSGQTTSAPTTSVPLATPTWIIPFRTGLTKKQQDSITTLLNNRYQSHTTLNETDAQNYAFAIGEVNVGRFVGRYAEEVGVRV